MSQDEDEPKQTDTPKAETKSPGPMTESSKLSIHAITLENPPEPSEKTKKLTQLPIAISAKQKPEPNTTTKPQARNATETALTNKANDINVTVDSSLGVDLPLAITPMDTDILTNKLVKKPI